MPDTHRPRLSGLQAALAFTAVVTLARLIYTIGLCPYNLVEDEANYWVWSRHLDWSYYTKGPGIAWAIWASTTVFGTSEAAIRVVAVLANGITTASVAALAGLAMRARTSDPHESAAPADSESQPFNDPVSSRAPLFAAACVQLSPIFQGTAVFSTIDGPYAACWAIASLAAMLALTRRIAPAWLVCGAAIGIGFLFKYTILLLLPGLALFAWLARKDLRASPHWRTCVLSGLALMLLGFAPVIIWNHRNDWATIAHLLGHLGLRGGDMPIAPTNSPSRGYQPKWTLEFIGSQFGMVGPLLALGGCAAIARIRSKRTLTTAHNNTAPPPNPLAPNKPLRDLAASHQLGTLFLVCCAAPILLFYLAVSFIAEPEGNWAMGGYVTLLALAGCAASVGLHSWREQVTAWRALPHPRPKIGVTRRKPETFVQVLWHTSLIYGLIAGFVMLRLDWTLAAAKPIVEAVGPTLGIKPEKVLSGRAMNLFDAKRMGLNAYGFAYVRLRDTAGAEQGRDAQISDAKGPPFYIAQHYGTAAILSFYIPRQPLVKCSSSRMGGRRTPWDFWSDASLDDPALIGRPALLLGARKEQWEPMFERVEPVDTPTGRLEGEHKPGRLAFLGYGYKGWPREMNPVVTGASK